MESEAKRGDEHLERYMRRIRFLESHLARYEDENDYGTIDDEYKEYCEKKKESIFTDEEEEVTPASCLPDWRRSNFHCVQSNR